jgi:hypothetical protein
VHIENESDKPALGRKAKPGEQIAYNRTMHGNIQLHENEQGEYYPVVTWDEVPKLVRGEYIPIGNRIQFPKVWGRKYGSTILLEHKIEDTKRTILLAQTELAKLERCLSSVKEWPDVD